MDSIYLDHNATTPIRPEVAEAMAHCFAEGYANPASQHRPGQQARRVLDDAREAIADIVGANLTGSPADRLIFTSGGTEANTLAVIGISQAVGSGEPGQVIVSAIEHASVIEPAEDVPPELEQAIQEGLVEGRLPCAVAWDIAARFEMSRLHVANAAERLEVRIGPCQLGAF